MVFNNFVIYWEYFYKKRMVKRNPRGIIIEIAFTWICIPNLVTWFFFLAVNLPADIVHHLLGLLFDYRLRFGVIGITRANRYNSHKPFTTILSQWNCVDFSSRLPRNCSKWSYFWAKRIIRYMKLVDSYNVSAY